MKSSSAAAAEAKSSTAKTAMTKPAEMKSSVAGAKSFVTEAETK
jgi:hypothetical protein